MANRDNGPKAPTPDRATPRSAPATAQVEVSDQALLVALCGPRNENLKVLEQETGAAIGQRGNQIHLQGDAADVAFAERVIAELTQSIREGA